MSPTLSEPRVNRGSDAPVTVRAYESAAFEEAMARIEYMVANRRQAALLVGEGGIGKSTLLARALRQLRRNGHEAIYVSVQGISELELLSLLATKLATSASVGETRLRLWRAIQDRLEEFHCQGLPFVLFVDHADQATNDVQLLLLRLTRLEGIGARTITTILAADSDGTSRLHPRLLELCELRIELDSWSLEDTVKFLESQYRSADGGCPFLGDAAVRLHELAQGNPRRLVQLAVLAQLAGMDQHDPSIDAEIVSEVHDELTVPKFGHRAG